MMDDIPNAHTGEPNRTFLAEAAAFYEYALQSLWNKVPLHREFKTESGVVFRVISRGVWNHGAGPDFLDAVLEFGENVRKTGSIEIHRRTSDWIAHEHGRDPAYANVILHAIDMNDAGPGNVAFLPDTPVFLLRHILPEVRGSLTSALCAYEGVDDDSPTQGLCALYFKKMEFSQRCQFLKDASLDRLREKAEPILLSMIESGSEKTFLRKFITQMGIPGNRKQFEELANRVTSFPEEERRIQLHAIVWGESGLLPDPANPELSEESASFVRKLWDAWWPCRTYSHAPIPFQRAGRPLNSPERRIAWVNLFFDSFGSRPLDEIRTFLLSDSPEVALEKLVRRFPIEDPFWSRHTSFTSKKLARNASLAGKQKIAELLADVILPSLYAMIRLEKRDELLSRVEALYRNLPSGPSNRVTRLTAATCFPLLRQTELSGAMQQGLIHIHHTFCAALSFDCGRCALYRSLRGDTP